MPAFCLLLPLLAVEMPPTGTTAGSQLPVSSPPEVILPPRVALAEGMRPDAVRQLLGPPRRVTRQVIYQRYLEQWHYGSPAVSWVEFECRRGQEARLRGVHPPISTNR